MKLECYLILTFLLSFQLSYSQEYAIKEFGEKDGLVQSSVYCINQDENGLLWIGTDQGLYRYDGFKFRNYGKKDGMSDNEVFAILGDSSKFLLTINFIGKINYYSNGKIYNQENDEFLSQIKLKNTPSGKQISNSKYVLWGFDMNSFIILTEKDGRISDLKKIKLKQNESILNILIFKKTLRLQYSIDRAVYGVNEYNFEGELISNSSINSSNNIVPVNTLEYAEINGSSFTLIDTNNKRSTCETNLQSEIKYVFKLGSRYWVTTRNGVALFSNCGLEKIYFNHIPVNTVFEDKYNNIWIGTEGEGLKLLEKKVISNIGLKETKSGERIKCLGLVDSSRLVFGNNNLSFSLYTKNEKGSLKTHNLILNGANINHRITDLEIIAKDKIAFGADDGLYLYDLSTTDDEIQKFSIGAIKCILKSKNELYIGTSSGLEKINIDSKLVEDLWKQRVTSMTSDHNGNIWFGGSSGLFKFDVSTKVVSTIKGPISERRINHLEWNDNILYLATEAGIFALSNNITSCIATVANGLPDNNCLKLKNHGNNLWIATAHGLSKLNKSEDIFKIENYTINDGLESNHINDILIDNDSIYIATQNGVSVLNVNAVKEKMPYDVNIIEVYNNDTTFSTNSSIVLQPGSNSLSIYYAAVSNGASCDYKYRLNANDWETASENTVLFSDLKPGDYNFEVKAISLDGIESISPARVRISVLPFFYETSWFKFLLLLSIIFLVYSFMNKRQKNILRKERKKIEIQKQHSLLELEAIKAQINPHFIYNALNSIQYSIMTGANENAEEQLSLFSKLVRKTLDYSKTNFISLKQEIDYLGRYLNMEKLRFKETLEFEVSSLIEDTDNIFLPSLLIQPFVENSIKHGMSNTKDKVSKVMVVFTKRNDRIICEVEDFGVGIDLAHKAKNKPSGLQLSSNRAKTYNNLYNMDITIDVINKTQLKEATNGTRVVINFPIETKQTRK